MTGPDQALPLHLGTPEDFARVQSLLRGARFDEEQVCRVLRIASLADLGSARRDEVDHAAAGSTTLALLVRMFLLLESVARAEVEGALAGPALGSLLALDLLRPELGTDRSDVYYAPVLLYPVAGLIIVSDRHENPDGSPFVAPPDVVFPAIFAGTLRFLRVIPKSPGDEALDLCSGTGAAALVLSGHVRRVVASDLTARATHFARFNRLLNDCENVEVLQGDLYEPVAGRTFDRIVAHPPYVPALAASQVFRDAGETGETVLQRIVAGLPRHLRPGGTFVGVSAGWDTEEGPFEARIRHWLGDHAAEFDLILAQQEEMSPEQVARWLSDKSLGQEAGTQRRLEQRFARAALERNVYGAIVLRRVGPGAASGEPVTVRPQMSGLTDGSALEWALRWHRWRAVKQAAGELESALLRATVRLGAGLQVKRLQVVEESRLVQASIVLESERPFLAATRIEAWMLPLAADFGAGRSASEVYERARHNGTLPEGFEPGDFATLVAAMVERGYLEIDGPVFED